MKKTKFLALILCLSFLCTLLLPATAYADDTPDGSGMKISKTATANKDGSYAITLEAFATGSKVITEQKTDIPTDIVLVIDQSGSMKDPMGGYTYNPYQKGWSDRNYHNDEYYPLRHNSGSENLWYKLSNDEYVAVSVEQEMVYTPISGWDNGDYYSNQNNLYCFANGEYKRVNVTSSWGKYEYYVDGSKIGSGNYLWNEPTFDNGYAPLYQSVKKYTYSYTLNGVTTVIEESSGDGSSPDTQFYRRDYSSSAGDTRLNALKAAVTNFSNTVAAKTVGVDGVAGTADDVNHRIAVVGYASRYDSNKRWKNTEVFVGANQYNYNTNASQYYGSAFQDMHTPTGKANITASIGAFDADGATYTNYGLEMANGILNANPVPDGETRNRVIVLFTDGYPGRNADNFDRNAANAALTQATIAKNNGVSLYSVGIFPGADATTAGDYNGSNTDAANWFMQQVSSNNGTPQSPSYYLSAADAGTLNSIFQQISSNITTGGTSTTLDANTVIKDIISPQFTLPEGAKVSDITLETWKCTGKNANGDYTWEKNADAMGATAEITSTDNTHATTTGNQVSVTGFDFKANYVGEIKENGVVTGYRGNKLVIKFNVTPRPGFLGGNDVITNASAGIYENGSAQTPVMTFEQPTVNVPIEDVTVTAADKNVYLLGEVTADQLKTGATVKVGDVTLDLSKADQKYGLEPWQTEFVNITATVKDKATGNEVTDFKDLVDDKEYTIEVTVSPKTTNPTSTEGTVATVQSKSDVGNIYVFKPVLTFKDSEAYYGADVPTYTDNLTKTEWKHTTATGDILGTAPKLDITYTPEAGKIADYKINTKQDFGVDVTVKIDNTDVTDKTTFLHTACTGQTCALPEGKEFLIHVKTCQLNITKQGGAEKEPYVFTVKKDGQPYTEVTIVGNDSVTIYELPVGDYTIEEDTGWSWRYNADNGSGAALSAANPNGSITCTNSSNGKIYWLNGFSQVVKNIFSH